MHGDMGSILPGRTADATRFVPLLLRGFVTSRADRLPPAWLAGVNLVWYEQQRAAHSRQPGVLRRHAAAVLSAQGESLFRVKAESVATCSFSRRRQLAVRCQSRRSARASGAGAGG